MKYTDDLGGDNIATVNAYYVHATEAHAKVLSIDTSSAESMPGFLAYLDAKDPHPNSHPNPRPRMWCTVQLPWPVLACGVQYSYRGLSGSCICHVWHVVSLTLITILMSTPFQ